MTAFDYGRPLAAANRLIARFGQAGSIVRAGVPSGPAYDPTPGTPTVHPAQFVITDFDSREVDGTRILASDKKALLAPGALSIEPSVGDSLVEADGATWAIIGVETLKPATVALLHSLQIRR